MIIFNFKVKLSKLKTKCYTKKIILKKIKINKLFVFVCVFFLNINRYPNVHIKRNVYILCLLNWKKSVWIYLQESNVVVIYLFLKISDKIYKYTNKREK